MASPAMHESHLPSWTSPHIRIMLSSIFNAHSTSGAFLSRRHVFVHYSTFIFLAFIFRIIG
jgi:hypothetical protein